MTSISYEGNIEIKIKDRPPVKSTNSGTRSLFNCLLNFLSRAFSTATSTEISSSIPCYMSIVTGINPDDINNGKDNYLSYTEKCIINQKLLIDSRSVDTDDAMLTLSCLLSGNQIINTGLTSNDTCYLLLIDGKNNILAFSDFKYHQIESISNDATGQAVVYWYMSFKNTEKGELQ